MEGKLGVIPQTSVKGQAGCLLGFVDHTISLATAQLCCYSRKSSTLCQQMSVVKVINGSLILECKWVSQ